jgi:hypothetical protein
MSERSSRRTIGFVLFASSLAFLLIAALIGTGGLDLAGDGNSSLAPVLGVVGVLDAILGVYFVMTGPSEG